MSSSTMRPLWAPLLLAVSINAAYAQDGSALNLDTLEVMDNKRNDDNFADDGPQTFEEWKDKARNQAADLGPLGDRNILDLPYQLNTVSYSLIKNQQIKNIQDALRYIPSVQGDGARPQARGMQGSVVQNSRINGFNIISTTQYPIEQFDRIEVMNGLAGSLYGPANPAGTFNFVSKRPTDETRNRITMGVGTGLSWLKAADLSGPIPSTNNRIKYRLNLLDDSKSTYTNDGRISRKLASLGLDFQVTDNTVIETNTSHYEYKSRGLPATVAIGAAGINLPHAPDPTKSDLGQHWAGDRQHTNTFDFHIKHNFDDNWKLDMGALRQIADRESTAVTYTFANTRDHSAYTTGVNTSTASRFTITSYLANLNGHVQTGFMDHNLTFGASGFVWNNYNPKNGSSVSSGTTGSIGSTPLVGGDYDNPTDFAKPDFLGGFQNRYRTAKTTQTSLIFGDTITLTPKWIISGTASWSRFAAKNWKAVKQNGKYAGSTKSGYSEDYGWNQALSLTYKPTDDSSVYFTYADSLQQGDPAPTNARNAQQIIDPYRSRQWEVGAKAVVGGARLSLAAYQIKRPYQAIAASGYYDNIGEQRNRGVDFTVDGKLTDDIYMFGGVSWLQAELRKTGNDATNEKRIVGLPRYTANLLTEYTIPNLRELVLNLNARYVGRVATDRENTLWYGDYHLFDVGARYTTKVQDHETVFRLQITNLTDRHYWTNIHPGGINGYGSSGFASANLGTPRMFQASVQVDI